MSAAARSRDDGRRSRIIAGGLYTAACVLLAAVAAWPVYASVSFAVLVAVAVPVAAGLVAVSMWRRWGHWRPR